MSQQIPPQTSLSLEPLKGFSVLSKPATHEPSSSLHKYLILTIIANLSLLFLNGHGGDLGFWQDWVRQLSQGGYDGFNGNYPPMYIHWLYLVGKFYSVAGIPLENNDLLKFLSQIPVTITHCLFTLLIFNQLQKVRAKPVLFHVVMILTVFNPAILVNGPMWGQIDLIPAVMVYASLVAASSWRYAYFAIPLFALALLTKFQTIAFAPIFGFLFFNKIRHHMIGTVSAVFLGAIVFLPSILAGHFWQSVRQAYIDTLGQYPVTTLNAANLWILITGNNVPDNVILFGISPDSFLAKIFMAKHFGMLLFSGISLLIFMHGIYFLIKNNLYISSNQLLTYTLFAATLCALAFFTLLPAMHERYSFPAAVMALGYCAASRQKIIYPALISIICALNMLIILNISGSDIWIGLSWITVILLAVVMLDQFSNHFFLNLLQKLFSAASKIKFASLVFFIVAHGAVFAYLHERHYVHNVTLHDNQILLTELPLIHAHQDHGAMTLNRSFDGNPLSIANRRYAQGIGTHSRSDIVYRLPDTAKSFSFMAALDDEIGSADVQFSVWGDDKLLWKSPTMYGYERHIPTHTLDVSGVKLLSLRVDPVTDDRWDHANWVNTIIELQQVEPGESLDGATTNAPDTTDAASKAE